MINDFTKIKKNLMNDSNVKLIFQSRCSNVLLALVKEKIHKNEAELLFVCLVEADKLSQLPAKNKKF